jgi:hypothetical protein
LLQTLMLEWMRPILMTKGWSDALDMLDVATGTYEHGGGGGAVRAG